MSAAELIDIASPSGRIRYRDSRDHFENGLLRLLGIDRGQFEEWLRLADAAPSGELYDKLRDGFARLKPLDVSTVDDQAPVDAGPGGIAGRLWHPRIAENPDCGVALSLDGDFGWLIREASGRFVRETAPPVYEEAYFEGDVRQHGGYGNYAAQSDWRIEKAERQVREIREATGVATGRALDVGSSYGYFRKALESAGFEQEGIEISRHARDAARARFGFETLGGTLEEHAADLAGRFDLLTLWDVLEHVADPIALLETVWRCLRPDGVVAIKTPNIRCPEAHVFGPHYHSLKREHLVYFSARSLIGAAERAGFQLVELMSICHLLVGFIGAERARAIASELGGADLVGYFRRAR